MSSPPVAPALAIKEGTDAIIPDDHQTPYIQRRNLGHGQGGIVVEVEDIHTGRLFALKTFDFRWARNKADQERYWKNEVAVIRTLGQHHHIIGVHATYLAKRQFGIVLDPVADSGNLDSFLSTYVEIQDTASSSGVESLGQIEELAKMKMTLEKGVGCLASGLAFMHKQRVRHKDVKSHNILVHQGKVIYTDFGFSFDCSHLTRSTTEGPSSGKTRRYAAPEVLAYEPFEPRNSSAHIFSLGCVYIEIFWALTRAININDSRSFAHQMSSLHVEIANAAQYTALAFLPVTMTQMTVRDPDSRWNSHRVLQEVSTHSGRLCAECLPIGTESKRLIHDHHAVTQELQDSPQSNALKGQQTVISALSRQQRLSEEGSHTPWNWSDTHRKHDYPSAGRFRRVVEHHYTSFFVLGRVFKMLLTEPSGQANPGCTRNPSRFSTEWRIEKQAFCEIRHFLVVRNEGTFSMCIQIYTYDKKGLTRSGLRVRHLGIIHMSSTPPEALPGEDLTKYSIQVEPTGDETLAPHSRANYGEAYAVEHDVEVIDIGMVTAAHRYMIQIYYDNHACVQVPDSQLK